ADGECDCGAQGDEPDRDPRQSFPSMLQQQQHHEWPDEVKLLLDGARPEMAQGSEPLRRGVSLPDTDLIPVAHVERAAEEVAASSALWPAIEEREIRRDESHHHEQGGK